MARGRKLALLLLLTLAVAGCGSTARGPVEPPKMTLADVAPPDAAYPLLVWDPLEPINRTIYTFNAGFDRYVLLPAVRGYVKVTPPFVRDRVSDFFININEFRNFTNSVLQLNGEGAGRAALRFVINVMFGFGGLYDIAGAKGIPPLPTDFGETLGYWGAGPGPFLVIPVFGPSNVRDGTGLAADALAFYYALPAEVTSSIAYYALAYGLRPIDLRYRTAFRYYGTGSPFEYDLVRFLYTEKRKLDIEKAQQK
ncbi:MAG TPA: VacJ family lipoprotein [Geminicoccaceae bacterium]|nr:VacJ family lipoprotein [Geminicoccaceae bacterium]